MKTPTAPEQNLHHPDFAALRETLLKVAILGTSRQALDADKIGAGAAIDPLSQLLAQLDFSDREHSVLNAAAILFQYEHAGRLPAAAGEAQPLPCPADEAPRCNAAASTRIAALLNQSQSPLLAEWLRVAAEYHLRVPEEYLPELLDIGRRQSELRSYISAVIGNRGRWLAAQNPAWSYGVTVSQEQTHNDEIWHTGVRAERTSFLQFWRKQDAAKARELLASTWAQEPFVERVEFLTTLATGLSSADEEFLESALDDKRKEVRQTAAELLAKLPESRLVARNFERLKKILTLTTTSKLKKLVGRGAVIEVSLPDNFDKAMARDGIEEKWYGGGKQGQKAGWVQQMLSVVPPMLWEREWKSTPQAIIAAASAGEWKELLLQGFIHAAAQHHATEWLEVLSEKMLSEQNALDARVLPNLPADTLERLTVAFLQKGTLNRKLHSELAGIVAHHQTRWSPEFTRALLDVAREEFKNSESPQHWLRYSLKNWAFWIPPELYEEASAGWPTQTAHWDKWESVVNEFLGVLETRRNMLREMKESN